MRSVLFFFLLAIPSRASNSEKANAEKPWSDWLSDAQTFRAAGHYPAAANAFREALALAEQSDPNGAQVLAIEEELAGTYAEAGQYTESEVIYRRALKIVAKIEGQRSLNYAVLLASVATLPLEAPLPEEQIQLLRDAITRYAHSAPSEKLAIVRGCLGEILKVQKRYAEAAPFLLDALTDLSSMRNSNPHLTAAFLNDLAMIRLEQNQSDESISLQRKSIQILEDALGPTHPSLVAPYNNLAVIYTKVGRLQEAKLVYQCALELCRKSLGESHQDYAVLLENYAALIKKLGRKQEARRIDAQGREIERLSRLRNGVGFTIGTKALR